MWMGRKTSQTPCSWGSEKNHNALPTGLHVNGGESNVQPTGLVQLYSLHKRHMYTRTSFIQKKPHRVPIWNNAYSQSASSKRTGIRKVE